MSGFATRGGQAGRSIMRDSGLGIRDAELERGIRDAVMRRQSGPWTVDIGRGLEAKQKERR